MAFCERLRFICRVILPVCHLGIGLGSDNEVNDDVN